MRHVLVVADAFDDIDNVVGELLHGVVDARLEPRLRAVVVHAQAAADVEELDPAADLPQLRIHASRLLHRVLHALDVGDLRADVKVQQFQLAVELRLLEHPHAFEQFGRG